MALLWAVWHMTDHFAAEGWGLEQLLSAPVVFAIEFVSLFFARALFVWFYNRTGFSVLLVAIFHASFDASISQLSRDVAPRQYREIPDLQRGDPCFRGSGDHRHQRPAGTARGYTLRARQHHWRSQALRHRRNPEKFTPAVPSPGVLGGFRASE